MTSIRVIVHHRRRYVLLRDAGEVFQIEHAQIVRWIGRGLLPQPTRFERDEAIPLEAMERLADLVRWMRVLLLDDADLERSLAQGELRFCDGPDAIEE